MRGVLSFEPVDSSAVGKTPAALHIDQLCQEHGVTIEYVQQANNARADRRDKVIAIAPVRSATTYLVALHELGHVLCEPFGSLILEQEANAWRWALDYVNDSYTTPTAYRRSYKRLDSYRLWAVIQQLSRRPPVIPPEGALFWQVLEELYRRGTQL